MKIYKLRVNQKPIRQSLEAEWLATLLVRVNCLFFKVNFQKKNYLWVLLCFKVGGNCEFVLCSDATLRRVQNPVQIKAVLLKISEKVLATITLKYYSNFLCCCDYWK